MALFSPSVDVVYEARWRLSPLTFSKAIGGPLVRRFIGTSCMVLKDVVEEGEASRRRRQHIKHDCPFVSHHTLIQNILDCDLCRYGDVV